MEYVIKINGKTYTQVQDYKVSYNQTWAPGSERDMYGTWNGTILGNFDSIDLSIMPKNKDELSTLVQDLRGAFVDVEYYDFVEKGYLTFKFYRANFDVTAIYISELETNVELVKISFVPEKRR